MKIRCESASGQAAPGEIELLPSKAICVGRNYRAHAAEMGHAPPSEPLLFMKPASALCANGAAIARPTEYERVDHEGDLWVLEANPNPCLSADAGFCAALAEAGIEFDEAIAWLIERARDRMMRGTQRPAPIDVSHP